MQIGCRSFVALNSWLQSPSSVFADPARPRTRFPSRVYCAAHPGCLKSANRREVVFGNPGGETRRHEWAVLAIR
jgi:hypothetical protein